MSYTLVYTPGGQSHKAACATLSEAVCTGRRTFNRGGQALCIEQDGEEILDGDELLRIFARLKQLEDISPGGDCRHWAERVLAEMGIARE